MVVLRTGVLTRAGAAGEVLPWATAWGELATAWRPVLAIVGCGELATADRPVDAIGCGELATAWRPVLAIGGGELPTGCLPVVAMGCGGEFPTADRVCATCGGDAATGDFLRAAGEFAFAAAAGGETRGGAAAAAGEVLAEPS